MRRSLFMRAVLLGLMGCLLACAVVAQQPGPDEPAAPEESDSEVSVAPARVDVNPVARDEEIRRRLQNVLEATGWFVGPQVEVDQGVVFLNGRAETDELKKWAGDLARNTQDVVAVVNRIEIIRPSIWDFRPAWNGLLELWGDIIHSLPFILFGLLVLGLSLLAGMFATRSAALVLTGRVQARLLRKVIARGVGVLVFLAGVYLILRVSGLTQLALTVVGGTGLIGLAVGIAFRDITENFLASIFLSMQQPFHTGDLVEVSGETGYVQQLNMRTTVLMTLAGNLVQIPNATVYKTNIRNFTANANRREDFTVGIGYDDSIVDAQEVAQKVLADHPAVLNDPEPSVLVESLGMSTVNLRAYFWINGREHSWLKVRSSVIRLVKRAFQQHGISMPDEAREVVFPKGIPVTMIEADSAERAAHPRVEDPDAVSTSAEAGLYSEAGVIEEQARHAQPLKEAENLLESTPQDEQLPPNE